MIHGDILHDKCLVLGQKDADFCSHWGVNKDYIYIQHYQVSNQWDVMWAMVLFEILSAKKPQILPNSEGFLPAYIF